MKQLTLILLLSIFALSTSAQEKSFQLSSHILDVSKGIPASDVTIKLEKYSPEKKTWTFTDQKITDENGRITDFLPKSSSNKGIYRFTYFIKDYFEKSNTSSFYPFIEVVFEISDDKHYHVPITLSAYGYSTYRGN